MNYEKEIDNEATEKKFDARIVQTVRHLKKTPSRQSDNNNSNNDSDNSNSNNSKDKENILTKSHNVIRKISNKDNLNNNMRISIDGSGHSTSDSNKENEVLLSKREMSNKNLANFKQINTANNPNYNKFKKNNTSQVSNFAKNSTFKTQSSSNIKLGSQAHKTKSEFQKRLMSESNLSKYRSMCALLMKEDEDLKKLCEFCNIFPFAFNSSQSMFGNSTQLMENFIEETFFSDKFFLYKLESLLTEDVSKIKKEKFFKEEIKKFLEYKSLDIQYHNKIKGVNLHIDSHIKNIENFDFFG